MLQGLFDAIRNNLISGGAYYLIAKAVIVTVVIFVIAAVIAGVFGAVCAYFMCYYKKVVSRAAECVCFFFRSTPALLLLLLFYYVCFSGAHGGTMLIAALAIGCYGAGHFAELIAKSVKDAQVWTDIEVRRRLKSEFFTAALPQALEDSLFLIKRLLVQLLHWTTVVGYISVNDLTEVMLSIGQRTMYPFFSISICILFHLLMVILIEWLFWVLKKRRRG